MTTRAGVSENVFSEIFTSFEECYRAAYEEGLGRLARAVEQAAARGESWSERVRAGVVGLLGFFDDEPQWGRLLVSAGPVAGTTAPECRRRLQRVLAGLLEDCRDGDDASQCPPSPLTLTSELVVGGVLSVVAHSMLDGDDAPLVELAPSLIAFIEMQYGARSAPDGGVTGDRSVRERSRPLVLPIRATHRTTLVLRAIARAPYSNNREVAHAAGLTDEGQASKLLARLERQGVIVNVGAGPARGEPNAWLLTASGERTLALIAQGPRAAASRERRARAGGAA